MLISIRSESALARFFQLTVALLLSIAATQAHSRPLNDDDVEAIIATMEEMDTVLGDDEQKGPEDQIEDERDGRSTDISRFFSGLVEEIEKHPPTKEKLASMVQRHGFKDPEEWAAVGDRVYAAYAASQMEGQPAMTQDDIDRYMARIEDSPMPEAQKTRMRNNMENMLAANRAFHNVPDEDIQAVRPYAEEIIRALQMADDE